jgi:hypothetical protein
MPLITAQPRDMQDGTRITYFSDTVGPSATTYTFGATQETITLKNKGSKDLNYTIGSNTGVLIQGDFVRVTGSFDSLVLSSSQGTQRFEILSDEVGTVGTTPEAVQSLSDKVTSFDAQLAEITNQSTYSKNFYPDYKGANLWISDGESVSSITTNLTNMRNLGMNAVFICSYNTMPDLTGSTINANTTDTQINGAIDAAKSLGFEFICIKPHVFTSGSINPSDINAYMTAWTTKINHYADLSVAKGLTYVVIVNEQRNVTNKAQSQWQSLIDGVKTKGLKVMATYAGFSEYDTSVIPDSSLDNIGINYYPPIDSDISISTQEAKHLLSLSYSYVTFGKIINRLKSLKTKYPNGKVFISEIGCTRNVDGLKNPAGWTFSTTNQTMQGQVLYYSAFMTLLCERELIDGIMYWMAGSSQATDTFNCIGNTDLANVIKAYVPGGVQ